MTAAPPPTIGQQYAAWPYPKAPLLARVPALHPWQLHCDYLLDRSGSGRAPAAPRIWIAGCGAFQPYVFGLANPKAEIVATDLSAPSLERARRRCRLHGIRNVQFAPCDLHDEASWPEGEFDLIECYGVLMNLQDPTAVLRRLARRLSPNGVLRLMVYPLHSRARIFQLQRIARLCGLHAGDRSHPQRLRRLVASLAKDHPLRWAFFDYADSRNDAGIVDAFLHRGDRGVSGWQLLQMADDAGLRPAFWFHRPWAQPEAAALRLGLPLPTQADALGYLDLWQELRQNFVVCLRRKESADQDGGPLRPHPAFGASGGPVGRALAVWRLRALGGRIPTKTEDGEIVLRAADARRLWRGDLAGDAGRRLAGLGLALGEQSPQLSLPALRPLPGEDSFLARAYALRLGRRAPNPLYAHLFAAWEADRLWPGLGLPDLDSQLKAWLPLASPLEEGRIHFGLSPYATAQRRQSALRDHLERGPLPVAEGYDAVRLRGDAELLARARSLAKDHGGADGAHLDDAGARELALLCFLHEDLFVNALPA